MLEKNKGKIHFLTYFFVFPNGAETEVLVVGNMEYLRTPPERKG